MLATEQNHNPGFKDMNIHVEKADHDSRVWCRWEWLERSHNDVLISSIWQFSEKEGEIIFLQKNSLRHKRPVAINNHTGISQTSKIKTLNVLYKTN